MVNFTEHLFRSALSVLSCYWNCMFFIVFKAWKAWGGWGVDFTDGGVLLCDDQGPDFDDLKIL